MVTAIKLTRDSRYSWEQIADQFDFEPGYISVAGGMISRPELGALLLITHAGGARANVYGDYWDGDELVYTGRGKRGDQKRDGQNRDLGDNQKDVFVFEPDAHRELRYLAKRVASTSGQSEISAKTKNIAWCFDSGCVSTRRQQRQNK